MTQWVEIVEKNYANDTYATKQEVEKLKNEVQSHQDCVLLGNTANTSFTNICSFDSSAYQFIVLGIGNIDAGIDRLLATTVIPTVLLTQYSSATYPYVVCYGRDPSLYTGHLYCSNGKLYARVDASAAYARVFVYGIK